MASTTSIKYRLALDLGSTSLGWAILRLNQDYKPTAIIKAGVRIFSDGRNPKDGSSLAVTRRNARAMRRRRDRLLKRKNRMMKLLLEHGLFPVNEVERQALQLLNPYELRAKGLNEPLKPAEFARALFHINQRRGFKSNRKTDKKENDSGALKAAISALRQQLDTDGKAGKARTVGELLWRRMQAGYGVRARYRECRVDTGEGKSKIDKSYDLYIDRAMIESEFDLLWSKQASFSPELFNEIARAAIKDCLLYQRPLKPVKPGRCTLEPEEERAPLALPSQQSFRIYQEVNNLQILNADLTSSPLTLQQRNSIVSKLKQNQKQTFTQIKGLLGLPGTTQFNLEDVKRKELKGNSTNALLSKKDFFGPLWLDFSLAQQDEVVMLLLAEENENTLIARIQNDFGLDEAHADAVACARIAEGYGNLSAKALAQILPHLQADVITYAEAANRAGYHHSQVSHAQTTGEILPVLPYYGEYLQRHVGFGSNNAEDTPEKRYGKIANPTVHIGLNQVRVVVNSLIRCYGHPSEVIVEVARELKQSREQRQEEQKRQTNNQKRNDRLRECAARMLSCPPERVRHADIQKLILWEELSNDAADRRCPYSGVQISARSALSDEVEIEHILPFSRTLDDSLNNKTLATRKANRIKGNRTPAEARSDFENEGWPYEEMVKRAELMPKNKRYRFGTDGYERWLREDNDFLARALNDTRYLSRVAREYLSLICPKRTRVIPGQMTAMLRAKFGLNHILGPNGKKNRNDHRHHAVDACVIAITDQGMLQKFAKASANAREKSLGRLVEDMPVPWPTYFSHVQRAIDNIWVSHKPDHGYEGPMMEATSYGIRKDGSIKQKSKSDGSEGREIKNLICISEPSQPARHGVDSDGKPLPYIGYVGGSNYCMEITRNAKGKWEGHVISTFDAYQFVRQFGDDRLRQSDLSISGKPVVLRLIIDDAIRMEIEGKTQTMRVVKVAGSGQMWFAPINEANVDARNKDKNDPFSYTSKMAGSLQAAKARRVTVSPIGELRDKGYLE